MTGNEAIAEGQIPINEPENIELENNEPVNDKVGEFWVDLNEIRNNNSSELLQAIRDLKDEVQTVKENNERILKAQEELNHIMLGKIHDQ